MDYNIMMSTPTWLQLIGICIVGILIIYYIKKNERHNNINQ